MVKPYTIGMFKNIIAVSAVAQSDMPNGALVVLDEDAKTATLGAVGTVNAIVMNYLSGDDEYLDPVTLKKDTDVRCVNIAEMLDKKVLITNASIKSTDIATLAKAKVLQGGTDGLFAIASTTANGYYFTVTAVGNGYVVAKVGKKASA